MRINKESISDIDDGIRIGKFLLIPISSVSCHGASGTFRKTPFWSHVVCILLNEWQHHVYLTHNVTAHHLVATVNKTGGIMEEFLDLKKKVQRNCLDQVEVQLHKIPLIHGNQGAASLHIIDMHKDSIKEDNDCPCPRKAEIFSCPSAVCTIHTNPILALYASCMWPFDHTVVL